MNAATIQSLREESKRYRALASKIDSLLSELDATESNPPATPVLPSLASSPALSTQKPIEMYANLTQWDALLLAIEMYGPQTTRELWARLNKAGIPLKTTTVVSSIISRMQKRTDKLTQSEDGKWSIKT